MRSVAVIEEPKKWILPIIYVNVMTNGTAPARGSVHNVLYNIIFDVVHQYNVEKRWSAVNHRKTIRKKLSLVRDKTKKNKKKKSLVIFSIMEKPIYNVIMYTFKLSSFFLRSSIISRYYVPWGVTNVQSICCYNSYTFILYII